MASLTSLIERVAGQPYTLATHAALKTALETGWIGLVGSFTFASADAPTFVITPPADLTSVVGVGDRMRLTHAATVKYFIVTAIGANQITVYGGTQYALAAGAITDVSFSHWKSPVGFVARPELWTVAVAVNAVGVQVNPVAGTWYNLLPSLSLAIPIGSWSVEYFANVHATSSLTDVRFYTSLSTSATMSTDPDFDTFTYTVANNAGNDVTRRKHLLLAAKTTCYVLAAMKLAGTSLTMNSAGDVRSHIRAVSAYL